MTTPFTSRRTAWAVGLAWLTAILAAAPAAAQSGPYGNEWIVPGQAYYKVKVARDAIYRLDYQYLTAAGIPAGLNPSLLQLWRRGRQVAVYQGGNATALDPSTFLEFYGQRNDGALDADYYKNPADQPHKLYSFSTDTAAYFLTYGTGAGAVPGRRMATPVAAGGAPHPYRLLNNLKIEARHSVEVPVSSVYLPWLEKGEGFYTASNGGGLQMKMDTVFRAILPSPDPRLEFLLLGGNIATRTASVLTNRVVSVNQTTGVISYAQLRTLGTTPAVTDYNFSRVRLPLLRADITPAGYLGFTFFSAGGFLRLGYVRVLAPQANRWFTDRRFLLFQNDSTLGGPATYELDSIPATVRGYDVHDPWNVQRVEPTAAVALGPLARRFVFPSATAQQTRWLALYDAARPLVPGAARRVSFRAVNPALANYVIVTHPKLMRPAAGTPNAALAYAAYRRSAAGGGFDTLMVTAPQLYDQFHYGERSALALRHFARWLVAAAPSTLARPRHLLLLGKGLQPNAVLDFSPNANDPGRTNTSVTPRLRGEIGLDLVPTSSRSVSDTWYSCDFRNNDYVGKLVTGRVVASTPQMVMDYLAKVQAHETPGLVPWRKNALSLSGGLGQSDFLEFGGYMANYNNLIARPCFGGRVVRNIARNSVLGTGSATNQQVNIAPELNAGLSLITYFGHAAGTDFDVDFGYASNPANNYANAGKYPMMFFNGCSAAAQFGTNLTFGEDWLLTPNRGAVGMMGQTGFGYAIPLDTSQTVLYRALLNEPAWYGRPVAEVRNEASRRLQGAPAFRSNWGDIAVEQLLCTFWHGDPALRLYAPPLPDFQTSNAQLSIEPATGQTAVLATSPSFVLAVGVNNPGNLCARTDSLEIRVTRRFGNVARPQQIVVKTLALQPQASAVYRVELANTVVGGLNVFGNNTFLVELNPLNATTTRRRDDELDYANNTAQTSFNFLEGGVTLLAPPEFALIASTRPRLVAQTNDPNGPLRGYDFEADTVPTFNSPVRLQQLNLQATRTPTWQPALPALAGRDSVVWYWRTRFALPVADENPNWVVSSFRVVPGTPGGWSQSHHGQFRRDARQGVDVGVPGGRWDFTSVRQPLLLRTVGGGPARATGTFPTATFQGVLGTGIAVGGGASPSANSCGVLSPNLLAVAYDPRTLRPLVVSGGPYSICVSPTGGQRFYFFGNEPPTTTPVTPLDTTDNLNNAAHPNGRGAARHQQLQTWLANVPTGAYVALVSVNRLRYAAWPAATRTALSAALGSALINTLANGDPLALLAQKRAPGSPAGYLREVGPNPASAVPRFNQTVSLLDTLAVPSSSGRVVSTRIGPAQQWQTLFTQIQQASPTGRYILNIRGIDTTGTATAQLIRTAVVGGRSGYALGGIPARTYPYLQLELSLADTTNRLSPQLRQWLVTYRGLPEGVVRRDLVAAAAYDPVALAAQATGTGELRFPVKFENVSGTDFGPNMKAVVKLRDANQNNRVVKALVVNIPRPLRADSTLSLDVRLNVVGLFGRLTPSVVFNPLPGELGITATLPELFRFNNELVLSPFSVIDGNVPPVLDVAFDGRHILNGELVSPTPEIRVQVQDEDRLRRIKDASAFSLSLLQPGNTAFTPVGLAGNDVQFSVDSTSVSGSRATLVYQPGKAAPLADGVYTFRAQARDRSAAAAGSQDFEVKFEVVRTSTISNVYPYPNPVTSKARFVFTVTGSELPRDLKIQIMTLTGAVVREIFLAELGPLHIGHNLTDYAWDGTDQYGDRLANGTYLYRVSLLDSNGQFGNRATAGDKAFKNDWGKLVLLR